MSDRPNILFIYTDQQTASMMSCAGNRYVSTPAMDSIAAEGVRFERAYCANPVCVASRFSLMTGRLPSAINLFGNDSSHVGSVPDSIKQQSLGHRLRAAGYQPKHGGKVHLPKMTIEDVGFENICRDERETLADVCAEFVSRRHDEPFFLVASFINPHDICYMAIRDFAETERDHRLIRNGAKECSNLDEALQRPPSVDDATFFDNHCPPLPPNFDVPADEAEAVEIMLAARPFRINARAKYTEQRWREHRWAYARLTERVDRQIGKVLEALRASGQIDNTLIVFTSDHGDMDASKRLEHKSALYEESIRIPLIIRPPGAMKRGRVDRTHVVSNGLDLLPTLCDWAGVAPGPESRGRSLRPLVEKDDLPDWGRAFIPVEAATGRSIVTAEYKYTRHDIGSRAEQLLHFASDPYETRNAINDPEHAESVRKLRAMYEAQFGDHPRTPADVQVALI